MQGEVVVVMRGKEIRLERIMNRNTKKTVIIPMDHGVTNGPIPGLIDLGQAVNLVAEGGANAVIGHVGLALHGHRQGGRDVGLILHLSASTMLAPDPEREGAGQYGAERPEDGGRRGLDACQHRGRVRGQDARRPWGCCRGMHGMGYAAPRDDVPRGKNIATSNDLEQVKLAARVAAELGADIVKTVYTGDPESFREVTRGCPVPVVVAGGSKTDDRTTLELIEGAMAGGAAGISIGRNAFQHKHPAQFVRAAACIVHKNKSVEEALKILEDYKHDWKGHQDRTDHQPEHEPVGHRADGPRVFDGTD